MGSIEREINRRKRELDEEQEEEEEDDEEEEEDEDDGEIYQKEKNESLNNYSTGHGGRKNNSLGLTNESEKIDSDDDDDDDDNKDSELSESIDDDISEIIIQPAQNGGLLKYGVLLTISILALALFLRNSGHEALNSLEDLPKRQRIKIDLEYIDGLNKRYPNLLTPLEIRMIKSRLAVMQDEVSILMLLGKAKDSHCKLDPTFCVGQTIANVTQYEYNYLDASDPYVGAERIDKELKDTLNGEKYTILIDSLEKLPASEVMNLFQYIDKDETNKRRGMILFIVYTGSEFESSNKMLKKADIAEKILTQNWSKSISTDTLTSVISRICGSIIKVH